MPGKLIVIEGTDGSGKTVQTNKLVERLQAEGHTVKTLSFPTYGKESAKAVELYANGEFGKDVDPYFSAMLYAHNRKEETQEMQEDLAQGTHYIVNRYTSANAGHQAGKLPKEQRADFVTWLEDLEYERLGIPRPDCVIFLHVPPAIGQQLVEQKPPEERTYLKGATKDIHEADLQHLENAEAAFIQAAEQLGWTTIECATPELRSIEAIHEDLYAILKPLL
ncbi:MAG: thymidylate kinase [Candidatus Woesearchaeota archaeon]|nr:thymidylate kinase [Candidatus Woesearchaeota archaeon]